MWEEHLRSAKEVMFDLSENASLSIGHPELVEAAKICYDIYRPILEQFAKETREKLEKEGKESYWSIYDSPGLSYSKEGRINIIVNEELEDNEEEI